MKVVTQFFATDGTDDGDLYEIRRFYVQDDKIIKSPSSTILGEDDTDTISDDFCDAKKDLFGDVKHFQQLGGMKGMGESLDRGHVMIFSLWDDVEVNMLWLDSAHPLNKPKTDPGIQRGDCIGGEESTPTYLRDNFPNAYVIFRNAAVGEIGSTYGNHLNTDKPSTSPSNIPSMGCVEDPNEKFFYKMDTSVKPNVPIFKTCKWLSNRGNDNFVERVCSRKKSGGGKGPAKDVCFATCDSCPDPSASPSTAPSERCGEYPSDKFFLRMNKKVDPVVPVFKSCRWLSKLKSNKKRENICSKKTSWDGQGPAKIVCPQSCDTCPTSSPSSEHSFTPSQVPTEDPSQEPSNTQEPSARPVSDEGCCSFNYKTCDQSEFCNESESNCSQCNGLWIYGAPRDCLAKYSACTNDRNRCCSPAKCVGDNNYSQCVD